MMRGKRLIYWAAGLSIFTLVAHSIDAPDHLSEWWGYGAMFIIGAVFQFFYGIALLIQPWKYDENGGLRPDAERYGRSYYVLGIILALIMILLYIVTRSTGMPFLGVDAVAEPITILSLIPVVVNLLLLFFLIKLFRISRSIPQADLKGTQKRSV